MKAAVYTCITGGYDTVKVPVNVDSRIDYHLFTDEPARGLAPWQVHTLDCPGIPAVHRNRFAKMQPHRVPQLRRYDITLYVDGSIRIIGDVYEFLERCWRDEKPLYLYEHPLRRCVYEEARVCAIIGFDSVFNVARQMRRYRRAGFPAQAGLYEANVLVRRTTEQVAKMMEMWWGEYYAGVRRDQLSLTYASWRTGVAVTSLGQSDPRFDHRYFELTTHKVQRRLIRTLAWNWINSIAMRLIPGLARF